MTRKRVDLYHRDRTAQLRPLLERQPWVTSFNPSEHQYIVDRLTPEAQECRDAVWDFCEKYGYEQAFKTTGRKYWYVDIGDFTYWVMLPVLNRVPKKKGKVRG